MRGELPERHLPADADPGRSIGSAPKHLAEPQN
jgi:hypothetical protein